ncbi:MAG TPA: polysaccharide deacetylase family protein [Gemmatimonadaceae bacterium]|jgi:peptidoglycan/xylan/chitin deacetylase (PgdA/CDA1 family)|nr:polysaccharide deacetylase family protein [Gemmatimonadaceae bacterium]
MSSSAVRWLTRRRLQGKRLILAYHGIIPEGQLPAGERALFVPQRDFAMQLDVLADAADVVPLDQIDEPGGTRPRVAITFDDAYAGAVNQGVGELVKRDLPATIFVAPGRLNGHVFWWDALADGNDVLDPQMRHHALYALSGTDERVKSWAARSAMPLSDKIPGYARAATLAELAAAVAQPGITVGSHSWSHRNLAALGKSDIVAEVRDSRAWLRAEFGEKALDWFAYPYGFDSEDVHRAVAEASYAGGLRVGGGWHRPTDGSRFTRPRLCIGPGLSLAGFRARLNGARLA